MIMPTHSPSPDVLHRRETRRLIILPMLGLVVLMAAAVGGVALFPRGLQVQLVADWLLIVFMLCPAVLCVLPVTVGLWAAVAAMNRAHGAAARPLRKLGAHSQTMNTTAAQVADQVNGRVINWSARLGFIYKLMAYLESSAEQKDPTSR
jgi:hypothetical protein